MFDAKNANAQNSNTVDKIPIRFINPFPASRSKLPAYRSLGWIANCDGGLAAKRNFPRNTTTNDSQEIDRPVGMPIRRGVSRVAVFARDDEDVPIPAGHGREPGRTGRIHSPCPGSRCKG